MVVLVGHVRNLVHVFYCVLVLVSPLLLEFIVASHGSLCGFGFLVFRAPLL